jgi:hypothetical protein
MEQGNIPPGLLQMIQEQQGGQPLPPEQSVPQGGDMQAMLQAAGQEGMQEGMQEQPPGQVQMGQPGEVGLLKMLQQMLSQQQQQQ